MGESEKIRVLIVDDSDVIKFSLRNFFKEYDFEVIVSNDGLEGIEKARIHTPHVIFLDLMMPNLDGLKMLQVLKVLDELKDIPVIVISGNTSKQNVLRAIEAGAVKVLSKPLHKEQIKKSLREILGEEIFDRSRKLEVENETEEEMTKQMKKFFFNSFSSKIPLLKNYVNTKNKEKAYEIIHQLKGAGATAGFPAITETSIKVEELLNTENILWDKVAEFNDIIQKTFEDIEQEVR